MTIDHALPDVPAPNFNANRIAFLTKMVAAKSAMKSITKSKTNPRFNSKYADLGDNLASLQPALWAQGLDFDQNWTIKDGIFYIETEVSDCATGYSKIYQSEMPTGKIMNCQEIGAFDSYIRRYTLTTIFGLAAEDDDGNSVSLPATPATPAIPANPAKPTYKAPGPNNNQQTKPRFDSKDKAHWLKITDALIKEECPEHLLKSIRADCAKRLVGSNLYLGDISLVVADIRQDYIEIYGRDWKGITQDETI